MTQEEKELLLKDLCARLPYGVICDMWFERYESNKITEVLKCGGLMRLMNSEFKFMVKPYLFPLSSMTEEQKKEWRSLMIRDSYGILYPTIDSFDYIYKNHMDFRGLIPMDLALDATDKNIY